MSRDIKMVDLHGQYLKIKSEVDEAIQNVIDSSGFINGSSVSEFAINLASYSGTPHVIPCANGTDALQIAFMTLGFKPGDEIIMPSFNYVASGETAALLKLKPVFVDVHSDTFNIDEGRIEEQITSRTKAIVVVHLFGQMANMEAIRKIAEKHQLKVIEDNAQALGAHYTFSNGDIVKSGAIGHINTTSFFPTKGLGCFGDGGAIMTNSPELAESAFTLSKHGQKEKYIYHKIGCNSRLDTIQAAILNVKLKYLDEYILARQKAAKTYDKLLKGLESVVIPEMNNWSTHVFHQYVIKIKDGKRDEIQKVLKREGIPSMVYYPIPLHLQKAYEYLGYEKGALPVSEHLCKEVLALPIHTELTAEAQDYIISKLIKAINS